MKIRRIKLNNIRSHKESEVFFKDGITVFTGRTGSGKSSFLLALEWALFGNESGVSNSALLKRGSNYGKVIVEFEHYNSIYKIIRGLKRASNGINVDTSSLRILKEEVPIPIMERSSDLNQKIKEIIGYPKDTKARDLFEVTSYTRQDEIRKLIETSPEQRQEQIDKILQISKYKNTNENMRGLITYFEKEVNKTEAYVSSFESINNEVEKIKQELNKNIEKIKEIEKEYAKISTKFQKHENEMKERIRKFEEIENKKSLYDSLRGELNQIEESIKSLSGDINEISDVLSKLKKLEIKQEDYEGLIERKGGISNTTSKLKEEIANLNSELISIRNLGEEAVCPLCKQKITKNYFQKLEDEYNKKINEKVIERKNLIGDLEKIKGEINEFEEKKEELDKLKMHKELKGDKEKSINELKSKKENAINEINNLENEIKSYEEIKEKIEELREVEKKLIEKKASYEREVLVRKENIETFKGNLKEKEETLLKIKEEQENLKKKKEILKFLSKVREDIRNIREVVRYKFLEDFRYLFQKKFEEIRKFEEEYSVDIEPNYEPVAYSSSGEKVQINNLSGGEKTSVALAYRLALSNIAANIGGISTPEVVILDEPTLGFDSEDIKALPSVLRNIKSIPQIILVTHEDELKNAADFKYNVQKISGISKLTSLG